MDARAKPKSMPIKPEDALEVVGFDPAEYETVEDFRTAVEAKFVARAEASKDKEVVGKVLGQINSVLTRKFKQLSKEIGTELPEDAAPLDMLDHLTPAIGGLKKEVTTWKEKAEKGLGDDVVKEWEGKVKAAEKERDVFKAQAVDFGKKYEDLNTEITTSKKKAVVNGEWEKAVSGIRFASTVDELRKEGFMSKVRGKYRIDLDDEMKPRLVDAEKGEPIKHPKKAGELLTLGEALAMEAKELKLISDNPHGDKRVERREEQQERKPADRNLGTKRQPAAGWFGR